MSLRIANPNVVAKVEKLARAMGMTKTAVVETAVDRLDMEKSNASDSERMAALLARLDRIPDREDAFDPLPWNPDGLPQ